MARLGLAIFICVSTSQLLSAAAPNVVLITIDTLRADHLHCYGYGQGSTPNIDKLAAAGTRFTTVVTAAPLTLPSHCSIMTGTYPMFHGVRDNVGYKLDSSAETLAKILKRHGYATGAVVGSYVLDRSFGLGAGFDSYYDHFESQTDPRDTVNMAELKRKGGEVVDRTMSWIRGVRGRPFFAWAHLYDPHDPYDSPPPFNTQFAANPYDGEIAYVDQQVGRLIAFLNAQGLYENTLIVLTADHGESLGEHRELRHGYFIYDATLLVPLILKPPAAMAPRVVTQEVRSIDVAPTILQLLGLPAGKMMQGTSLTALMQGKDRESAPDAYSESFYPMQFGWSPLRSVRVRNLKYIDAPRPELYEIDQDPGELNNLAAEKPAVAGTLKSRLLALEKSSTDAASEAKAAHHLTPEELQKLASLGYVGDASAARPGPDGARLPDPKDNIDTFFLINRAGVDAGSGKCDSAIPTLLEIILKAPKIPAVYTMLGRCYFIQEKYQESMQVFDQLRAIDPASEDAQFYKAACEFNLDQLDAAEAGFRQVLAVNPKRAYAHKYLGFIYQAQGKPDLAIVEFQKVLESSPRDLEAHGKLGFLLASTSRLEEALTHFQRVVALSPADGSGHFNLGIAYEKLGNKAKATQELAEACKLDKSFCGK